MNEIVNTHDIAEEHWDGKGEPRDVDTDMVATHEATGKGIEFHVSMRSYTQQDMEELIVEAAASMIVGRSSNNNLVKLIEERCLALVTQKVDQHLSSVTDDIIDQPVTPKHSYGKPTADPVTMREFIGLTGRQYLSERVDNSGKVNERGSYNETSRIVYLVQRAMDHKFKNEIERATNAAVSTVQAEIRSMYAAIVEAEKARMRSAMEKAVEVRP